MGIKKTLAGILVHPWIRRLPAPSLVALALAGIIHSVMASAAFDASAAAAALARIGFEIGAGLVPAVIEAGKKGVEALGDWLERDMAARPEVNEAAARTMVEQAETVAQTLEETRPEDKDEIADVVGEGLKAYGGATSEIAETYSAALKNVAELNELVAGMKAKIDAWASQTIEARRGSLIENVEQRMKSKGGKQVIRAEDKSRIRGAKQTMD